MIDAMREPFAAQGLAVVQSVEDEYLYTTILHTSGESIISKVPLVITKNDSQGVGSSLTYSRRYGLAAACMISQTDDDGEAAVRTSSVPSYKPVVTSGIPYSYVTHAQIAREAIKELGITTEWITEHKDQLNDYLSRCSNGTKESIKINIVNYRNQK